MLNIEVSIVIVSYNVKQLLTKCIESIYFHHRNYFSFEIILVDNHSTDGTVEFIQNRFPEVHIIANKINAGFPKANNQAFEIAKGKYIFMLNPDTEFIEDSIRVLIRFMEENPATDLLAPMLLNTDKTRQLSVWRYPSLTAIFFETHYLNRFLKTKNYGEQNFQSPFQAESFSGAAIFFKRTVLEEIGLLDESMFWIEDVDFCYRANMAHLKCVYNPQTKIIHHIGQSAKKNYNVSISNQIVNKIKFFKKHYARLSWFLVVLLSFYHVFLKLIGFGLLSPFKAVYYRKFKAYCYTLPRVFNPPSGVF